MDYEEFRLALTHTFAVNAPGEDVALLWRGRNPVARQHAPRVVATETGLALPIVQLLRNHGQRFRGRYVITTSAPPTEACLGMARMCGIDYVTHLASGNITKTVTGRTGTTSSAIVTGTGGSIPNVTTMQGHTRVNVAWASNPALRKAALTSWRNYMSGRNTNEGRAAKAACALIPLSTVPFTPFGSSGLEYVGLKTVISDQTVLDNVFMMLAWEMVAQVSGFARSDKGVVSTVKARAAAFEGQNIGSLLVDNDGNIVSWGFNTNRQNSTRHGEINLIFSYYVNESAAALPADGTIYTTLEPCEMCSGAITRAVKAGDKFRVIYGQKDANVASTALQRKVNGKITMEGTKAVMATAQMIQSGSASTATAKLLTAIAKEQNERIEDDESFIATTKFLKEQSTYEKFFGVARPQWWLYLWDHLASRIAPRVYPTVEVGPQLTGLMNERADPEVMKLNNQLEIVYMLVDQFMKTVVAQASR